MTENGDTDLFTVGTVVGFHGLRGEVKVRPTTNTPEILLDIETAVVRTAGGGELQVAVRSIRLDRRMLFLSFDGYESRTDVESMDGALIVTPRRELRDLDSEEFWVSDLVGLEAFTTDGRPIGRILSIIDGGNQLLEISSPAADKTILVPFVRAFVPRIDLSLRRIEIEPIPGLLEPQ